MRSWVPDVAEEGGEEKKEREGRRRGPDEGTAMAAERNPISDTPKRLFTFPGTVAQEGKGGLGKVRGCRAGLMLFLESLP